MGKKEYARLALASRLWKWLASGSLRLWKWLCNRVSRLVQLTVLQLLPLCLTDYVTASYGLWKWLASSSLRLWNGCATHSFIASATTFVFNDNFSFC